MTLSRGGRSYELRLRPDHVLLIAILVVSSSSFLLPLAATHRGALNSSVALLMGLLAWNWLSSLSSEAYASSHPWLMWLIAGGINTVIFSVIALLLHVLGRWFEGSTRNAAMVAWCLCYLVIVFLSLPATEGP